MIKKDRGFIHIIVLVIIFVVVLTYFGKNPVEIWETIKPIFVFILELFVKVIDWMIRFTTQIWQGR